MVVKNRLLLPPTQKKCRISLSKLITFDLKKQIQQNKQVKIKLSNHDNTQFV